MHPLILLSPKYDSNVIIDSAETLDKVTIRKTYPKKTPAKINEEDDDEKKLLKLKGMLKAELISECKKNKLPTSGTKAELVAVLIKKKKKKDKGFRDMLKPDLIRACKEQGLPLIGLKMHLVSALERKEKEAVALKEKKEARRCT